MQRINIPLIKQSRIETCGPAALSMVLNFFEKNISEQDILKSIKEINKDGVRTIKLKKYAEKKGFKTFCFSINKHLSEGKAKIRTPSVNDFVYFLNKGLPVIVAVRAYFFYEDETTHIGHFIVLTGHDENMFYFNDPRDGKQHIVDSSKLIMAVHNNALNSSAYLLVLSQKK